MSCRETLTWIRGDRVNQEPSPIISPLKEIVGNFIMETVERCIIEATVGHPDSYGQILIRTEHTNS